MDLFKLLPLIVWVAVALISLLFYVLIKFLRKKDLKIDYSDKQIRYYIQNINGVDYLLVPYLFWQNGKLNEIKKRFSDYFEFEGKCYKPDFLYTNQSHLSQVNDLFPQSFYQDCKSVIHQIEPKSINCENINNTYINGDNNQVSI